MSRQQGTQRWAWFTVNVFAFPFASFGLVGVLVVRETRLRIQWSIFTNRVVRNSPETRTRRTITKKIKGEISKQHYHLYCTYTSTKNMSEAIFNMANGVIWFDAKMSHHIQIWPILTPIWIHWMFFHGNELRSGSDWLLSYSLRKSYNWLAKHLTPSKRTSQSLIDENANPRRTWRLPNATPRRGAVVGCYATCSSRCSRLPFVSRSSTDMFHV